MLGALKVRTGGGEPLEVGGSRLTPPDIPLTTKSQRPDVSGLLSG